jgi:hypothetical protein
MHKFTETHSEFEGFSEYYQETIYPRLDAADQRRKASLIRVVAASIGVIILTMIAAYFWNKAVKNTVMDTLILAVPLGGFAVFWVSRFLLKKIKSDTKEDLAGGICRFLGWHFSEKPHITPDLDIWTRLRLLPAKYQRVSFEDEMAGEAHGASFLAREAHMQKKVSTGKSTHWVTVFRGSLMVISFKRKFDGQTVVLRKAKILNPKAILNMKKVGLVDPVFQKIFQAYGSDQVEARYLLTPDFMQQLVDLETSVDGKKIRFGFWEGQLLIAVETKDRFEAGSMLKPLTDPDRAQKILNEIGAVYDVIDGVSKPRKDAG